MNLITEEMSKYTNEELKNIGAGIYALLRENYAISTELLTLAARITGDVFPYPKDLDAFKLTPQQIYYRSRVLQEIVTCKK